ELGRRLAPDELVQAAPGIRVRLAQLLLAADPAAPALLPPLAPDLIGGLADRDRHQQRPEVVAVVQPGEAAGGGAAAEAVEGAERRVLRIRRAAGHGAEPVASQVDEPVEVAPPELLCGRFGVAAGD